MPNLKCLIVFPTSSGVCPRCRKPALEHGCSLSALRESKGYTNEQIDDPNIGGVRARPTWRELGIEGCDTCGEDNLDHLLCPNSHRKTCVDCCPCHAE